MTHTENNTKIAKFIGYEITQGNEGKGIIRNGEHISLNKLKFHIDFNWLMEAVRKIEQLPNAYDTEEFLMIRDELCTGRVETVYSEVLNFVEWYNKIGNK